MFHPHVPQNTPNIHNFQKPVQSKPKFGAKAFLGNHCYSQIPMGRSIPLRENIEHFTNKFEHLIALQSKQRQDDGSYTQACSSHDVQMTKSSSSTSFVLFQPFRSMQVGRGGGGGSDPLGLPCICQCIHPSAIAIKNK